jgi:hypothetical protein
LSPRRSREAAELLTKNPNLPAKVANYQQLALVHPPDDGDQQEPETSDYILAEPVCVRWHAADESPYDYDFCITIKTSTRQTRNEVCIVGKGSIHIE